MKTLKILLFTIVGIVIAGCSTTSSIITDYDRDAQFNDYKTFYWADEFKMKKQNGGEDPLFYNSLIQTRLKNAIEKQMKARGYELSEETPDLLVNASVQMEEDRSGGSYGAPYLYPYSPFHPGFGHSFGHFYGYYGTRGTSTSTHMAGAIVVQLIDRSREQLVWQGYAPDILHTDTENKRKELNSAIVDIFSRYDQRITQAK
jgi:hypothetical protein